MFEAQYQNLITALNEIFTYSHAFSEFYPFGCLFSVFYILSMLLRYLNFRPDEQKSMVYHTFLLIQLLGFIGFAGILLLDEQKWENEQALTQIQKLGV